MLCPLVISRFGPQTEVARLIRFRRRPYSNELDAHPAHTKHDHCRNDPRADRAADHEAVGEYLADAMRQNDRTHSSRQMREDEEYAEPIMRHEADVPRVLYEAGGRARCEAPSGVDAEIRPRENEDLAQLVEQSLLLNDARISLAQMKAAIMLVIKQRLQPLRGCDLCVVRLARRSSKGTVKACRS